MTTGADRERMPWHDLPRELQLAAEELLGSPIVDATTQNGGFSPGSADRVVTADGRRAFVKTAMTEGGAESVRLHAHEATVVAALPSGLPVAACLGSIGRDGWVVAAYEDVDGRHPGTPWREDELGAVLEAFAAITQGPAPAVLRDALPPIASTMGADIRESGWAQVESATLDGLPDRGWALAACAGPLGDVDRFLADIGGDRLVHLDARADNILIRPGGSVVIIDWPYACIGAAWVDPLCLVIDAALLSPDVDVRRLLREHPLLAAVPRLSIARFLLQLAGHFLAKSHLPEPDGIPGLRAFQRSEGAVCLRLARATDPLGA